MDFRRLIRPATLKRMREDNAEVARLHSLDDRALAQAVLELGRKAIKVRGDEEEPRYLTYTTALTHQVIPFLARMVDPGIELSPIEEKSLAAMRTDPVVDMTGRSGDALRDYVGRMIDNASMTYGLNEDQREESAIRLLDRLLEHGNPVALVVDRLAPAPEGLARVDRPGNGPARYPAWQPSPERDPLPGLHLLATLPNGREQVVDYHDDHGEAEAHLARIANDGLRSSRIMDALYGQPIEPGTVLCFDLRNQDNASVSEIVEAPIWRDEPPVEDSAVLEL